MLVLVADGLTCAAVFEVLVTLVGCWAPVGLVPAVTLGFTGAPGFDVPPAAACTFLVVVGLEAAEIYG